MKQLQDYYYFTAIVKAGSILGAAETLAITATALNRRILSLESALEVKLFERKARGVRLSAAGEYFYSYAKLQIAEYDRLKSQISDLSGERRGHINIAVSQAFLPKFIPEQVCLYREKYQGVTFDIQRRDRQEAEQALKKLDADIAIIFEPSQLTDIEILHSQPQDLYALVKKGHPLSQKAVLRMSDCLAYPLAMPNLETGISRLLYHDAQQSFYKLTPHVTSDSFEFLRHYCLYENCVSFQIKIGLPDNLNALGLQAIKLNRGQRPCGNLYVAKLKNRELSIAAHKFCEQLIIALNKVNL